MQYFFYFMFAKHAPNHDFVGILSYYKIFCNFLLTTTIVYNKLSYMKKELSRDEIVELIKKHNRPTMKRGQLLFEVMFDLTFIKKWSWGDVYKVRNKIEEIIREVAK